MNFKHIKTTATDWSIINCYEIPSDMRFTTHWTYGGGWIDRAPKTDVTQKARYVSVTHRRSDNSVFDCQVLDEDGVTIRGKHCRGNDSYLKICGHFMRQQYQ